MARTLIHLPRSVRKGEPFEVRVLIAHPMETGYRPGADGKVLPRDIIRRFQCRLNGEPVFGAELHPAIAANPYLSFWMTAADSGLVEFEWSGDHGFSQVERQNLQVT